MVSHQEYTLGKVRLKISPKDVGHEPKSMITDIMKTVIFSNFMVL